MTLYQFNRLDKLEQLEALWENGAGVAEREDEINRYKLYQVDSFYVEEEFHKGIMCAGHFILLPVPIQKN